MKQLYRGKKVLVMGMGLHGGGASAVAFFVKQGAHVTVTDLRPKKVLLPTINKFAKNELSKVKFVLGKHRIYDFKTAEIVIQNPAVPKNSAFLKIAKQSGAVIENEATIFFKHCPAKIIGITGTRGKSSTTALIASALLNSQPKKVFRAGLPQEPMLALLPKLTANDYVALELSSWQLELLGEKRLSPDISVVTNIYPDHLNRYGSINSYAAAKENIFLWQKKNCVSVFNFENKFTKAMGKKTPAKRIWYSTKLINDQNGCYVREKKVYFRDEGKEKFVANVEEFKNFSPVQFKNILAALSVVGALNSNFKIAVKAITDFSGLPGRVETVGSFAGIKYVNDTASTTPIATEAAIESFDNKNLILIAGGDTKKIPTSEFKKLAKKVKQGCKAVVLLDGKGSDQILQQLKKIKFKPIVARVPSVVAAVVLARQFAKSGDVVLFSPACSSFNMFNHEFERGEAFNLAVKKYGQV